MTRLISEWVLNMPDTIKKYDNDLKATIGLNLKELAFDAVGALKANGMRTGENINSTLKNRKVAVIRSNTGQGVIQGFDEAIACILRQIGVESFTCKDENVAGIFEAHVRGADIVFMADDDRYIAFNTKENIIAENDYCTTLGFTTVLEKMANGLKDKDIALLGYGRLGKQAAKHLFKKGGNVYVYDKKTMESNISKSEGSSVCGVINNSGDIFNYKYIYDVTNEGGWLDTKNLKNSCYVSPGIPLSLRLDELDDSNVIWYDKLQIGTAVMLAHVL